MTDPFQIQRMPAQAGQAQVKPPQAVGPLQNASPNSRLLRPRGKRLLHAVRLLDLLTSGDESLHDYLSARAGEAKPDPFAARRSGADPLDTMTRTAPPPVDTQEFQALKGDLLQQCRETVQAETVHMETVQTDQAKAVRTEIVQAEAVLEDNVVYLAPCGLPLHRIHWIDETGWIIRHYRLEDLDTPLLQLVDDLLGSGFVLVEVHGGFPEAVPGTVLFAVNGSGAVEKVTF